jgi:carbonic anhydrase
MNAPTGWIDRAREVLAGGGPSSAPQPAIARTLAAVVAPGDFPFDIHAICGVARGTFYEIRTTGGLIPPAAGDGQDGAVGAALEFAVRALEVEHIILLAHPDCGLLHRLLDPEAAQAGLMVQGDFLARWTAAIGPAIARAGRADIGLAERKRFCAQEVVRVSIEGLMTYPWILDRAFEGALAIHGWYCDVAAGTLTVFDPESDRFA